MTGRRNYWVYSAALLVVWVVLLIVVESTRGTHRAEPFLYVFAGFVIAWVGGTIARYVYPPPARWSNSAQR